MKKKNLLSALFWSAIMIVVQVAVDLVRHTPINWIEVLIGAAIIFVICIGSKKNPMVEKRIPEPKNKVPNTEDNISVKAETSKNNNVNQNRNSMDANMGDLRFYAYNRIAIISLVIAIGCIVYGQMAHVGSVFWLYLVGIVCLIQAIVFFILYAKKRDEFVKKEQQRVEK